MHSLQTHVKILEHFATRGPLELDHLSEILNVESDSVKKFLDYLVIQNFVKEQVFNGGEASYSICEKGLGVLRFFKLRIPKQKQSGN